MLVDNLKAKQNESGLNDSQFAERLGVPRSTWHHTKVGIRRPGRKLVLAAMRAYPDLASDCVSFLLSDGTPVPSRSTSVA